MLLSSAAVFLFGVLIALGLFKLKERNLNKVTYVGSIVGFLILVIDPAPSDWRIFVANVCAIFVLFSLPVWAVINSNKFVIASVNPKYIVMGIVGLTLISFQYVGFTVSFLLGAGFG
jgi:hypothetical protein